MLKLPIEKKIIQTLVNRNPFFSIYLAPLFFLKLPNISNPAAVIDLFVAGSSHNHDPGMSNILGQLWIMRSIIVKQMKQL
jgi:hypothetical protein